MCRDWYPKVNSIKESHDLKILDILTLFGKLTKHEEYIIVANRMWFLDSGCSRYMASDASLFVEFVKKERDYCGTNSKCNTILSSTWILILVFLDK